jgi:hypothetical protein
MMVRTGLSVSGALLKLVSPSAAIGLADAQAAPRQIRMAADAAIRAKLMASGFLLTLGALRREPIFNCRARLAFKTKNRLRAKAR